MNNRPLKNMTEFLDTYGDKLKAQASPSVGAPSDQPAPQGSLCCDGSGSPMWAVSVVLIYSKTDGKMNITNHLQRVRAANKDEAIGCAIRVSMAKLPEHSVHCVTALEFQSLEND